MYLIRDLDDPRRRLLLQLLAAGSLGPVSSATALADIFGNRPSKMAAGRSIFRMRGQVLVNNKPANANTRITAGSTISTGRRSEVVFVAGSNAFVLRASSSMTIAPQENRAGRIVKSALRMLTGKMLAVFAPGRPVRIASSIATIGIRGTGVYMEADPEKTYFCTCYGTTDIGANNDQASRKTVVAEHHDEPVYILANAKDGKGIRPGPFINHTDQELMLIETLVGRTPPFIFPSEDYGGPRRDY